MFFKSFNSRLYTFRINRKDDIEHNGGEKTNADSKSKKSKKKEEVRPYSLFIIEHCWKVSCDLID